MKPKTKRVRWECPNGEHPGVLGSTRPPKDSIVRYCLPCSEASGRLVERVAPALERKRAAKTAARKTKAQKQQEREAARMREWPNALHLIFEHAKRLKCWRKEVKHAKLELRHSKTRSFSPGHAHYLSGRITMTAGSDVGGAIETLVHELAHIAHFERYERKTYFNYDLESSKRKPHGSRFYGVLFEASAELLGEQYMGGIRAAARERNQRESGGSRATAPHIDAELSRRYNRAVADGVFADFGLTETRIKAAPSKSRAKETTPGRVTFTIPSPIEAPLGLDDTAREWRQRFPELREAYDNGKRGRAGRGYYTRVEGPFIILDQLAALIRDTVDAYGCRAADCLYERLKTHKRAADREASAVVQLFVTLGKLKDAR
jgi:hypothetical protein